MTAMTTIRTLIAAACVLAGGTALAQPGSGTEPSVETPSPPPPQPPPSQPPSPPPPPEPLHVRALRPAVVEVAEPAPDRPTEFSIGVGVGYRFPTSLQTPNVSSVRFRLPSGFTFEPTLVFATSSHAVDSGTAATQTATELGIGALLRFPLVRHRRTELQLLAAVDLDNLSQDPNDQNTDDVTSITTTTLRYGVAVGAWITPHLEASLSATSGLVGYTKNRQEQGIGSVLITSDTTIGLIFNPTVTLMIHLYN